VEEIGTDPVQDPVTDPISQVLEVQMVQVTEKAIETVIIIAGEEVLEAVHVQDHVTAEMVFEAENLRLTKKNYWPLLRKMQLGCLVPTI
jgi:hypothetical protein